MTSFSAHAGPENGVTTAGSAAINQIGNQTTINQFSNRAVIRWDSFNLDSSERVQFVQPSANAIVINRILDNNPSSINGRIDANGRVVLINPNGILFGAASHVDVGGLVATTSDINETDFMNGGPVKFMTPGKPDARIINNGSIKVKDAGLVGLVAPHVENNGIIQAKLGKIQLASGDMHTIDFAGDGLIKLEVSDSVLGQSVTNTGTLEAQGGDILITAAQARHAVDSLITNTGTIKAETLGLHKGRIRISTKGLDAHKILPRAASTIVNSGTISVDGLVINESAGDIILSADLIALTDNARISAVGDINGGTIRIGGDYQGGPALPTSSQVFIGHEVILNASSRRRGNGGQIILWSDDHTKFLGHAEAKGGTETGNGGFIEISGKDRLTFQGTIDLRANHGVLGTLLLDPTDIEISNASDLNVSGATPFTSTVVDGPSILNITTLQTALAAGNVTVQTSAAGTQPGNITVTNAISWASANTLTLISHNDIIVNGTISGRNLTLSAGNDIQLNSGISSTGSGTLTIQSTDPTKTVGVGTGQTGVLNLNATDLSNITNGWGSILIGRTDQTGNMNVGNSNTWNDNVTFRTGTGTLTITGTQTMGGNSLTVGTSGGTVSIGGIATGGAITVTSGGGAVSTTGSIATTNSNVSINSGNAALTIGGTISTGLGTQSYTTTTGASNSINVNGALSGSGNVTFTTAGAAISTTSAITLTGAATLTMTSTGGAITIGSGGVSTATGNQTYTSGGGSISTTGTVSATGAAAAISFSSGAGSITTGALVSTTTGALSFTTTGGNITIGSAGTTTTSTGAVSLNAGAAGVITLNGIVNAGSSALNLTTNSDIALTVANALTGTGALSILASTAAGTFGIGDSQTGTINLTNAEVARIKDGFSSITFGNTTASGAVNVGALSWNDALNLRSSGTNAININGIQTMNSNAISVSAVGGNIAITGTTGTAAQSFTTTGTGTISATGALSGTGAVTLTTAGGTITTSGAITATTTSTITIGSGGGNISVAALGSATGAIAVNAGAGTLATTGAITTTSGAITLTSTAGGITIGTGGITASTGSAVTLNAGTGGITINNAIATGTGALSLTSDALALNANLTGTSTISILASSGTTTIGVGDSQTGTLNLTNAEIARIGSGFTSVTIGHLTLGGAMNVGAYTFANSLILRTANQMNINGNITMSANRTLALYSGADMVIGANLTGSGTGTITIAGQTAATTMGIGTGQTGTLQLTDAEVAKIIDGWTSITLGATTMTGTLNVGNLTWVDPLNLRTGTGAINLAGATTTTNNLSVAGAGGAVTISGAISTTTGTIGISSSGGTGTVTIGGTITTSAATTLTNATAIMTINSAINTGAAALTINTDANLALNSTLTGTGTLTIRGAAVGTGIGVGTGQAGTVVIDDTELGRISSNFTSVVFGMSTQTGTTNVGAYTWANPVTFLTGASGGGVIFNGTQTLSTRNLTVTTTGAPITVAATGSLSSTSGTVTLTSAGGAILLNGGITRTSGNMSLNSTTGVINVNSPINVGAGNLTISTNTTPNIAAALTGTGNLVIVPATATTTMAINNTGAINLTTAMLDNITDGWGSITFGSTTTTGAMNIGAYSNWKDPVNFSTTGIISLLGAQNFGANNVILSTNSDVVITGALSGSRTLTFQPIAAATTIGVAGGAGSINLSTSDLSYILNGWNDIVFGNAAMTGAITLNAYNWQYDTLYRTGTGIITVAGNQVGKNITFETNANLTINANLAGTGTLTISGSATGTAMSLATTAAALDLTSAELDLITDGWSKLIFGRNDSTGAITVGNYSSWADDVLVQSAAGAMTIGAQNMNGNDLTLVTNSNLSITGNLTSTGGNLVIRPTTPSTTMGLAGAAGTLALTAAELNFIQDGWGSQTYGSTLMTGAIGIGAYTWKDFATFITGGNIVLSGAQASNASTSLVFATLNGVLTNASSFAITPGSGGRYLLYYSATAANTMGGLTAPSTVNNQTYFSYAPGSVVPTGNVFINRDGATKVLYIVADDKVKVYGNDVPVLTYTYVGGLQGSDTIGASLLSASLSATGALTTDAVGTTRVITGTFTTGLGYTVQLTDGQLSVAKAPVTVTVSPATREYGDTNTNFAVTYTGLRNGETSSVFDTQVVTSTTATATTSVGAYGPGVTASGASDNNYTFNYISGSLTITPAPLVISTDNKTKVYGDANPVLTASYSGLKNGETSAVISGLTLGTSAVTGSAVGTYQITASGAAATNYTITYALGDLTVTPAPLTITAQNATRVYGDANPAFSVNYSGFKNGDTSSSLSGLSITTPANGTSGAGSYAITPSGAVNSNYSFIYVDGILNITKAMLTATVNNATRVYGNVNPGFTVSYTGFKNSEDETVINTTATATTAAISTTNVGSYAITASGALDNNYDFTYVDGTLGITKAILTATADNKTRAYGDANPALTITYTGFKNGETASVIDTTATATTSAIATTAVGSYGITVSGATDNNYDFSYVDGTFDITKAILTATADSKTRAYGDANPALTVTYTGFKNGEDETVINITATATTAAISTTNVGSYAITASGALDNNYDFTYVDGTLGITKAMLTATADNKTRAYGDANPALTITYTGFKNSETASVIDTTATATTAAVATTGAGSHVITASGALDNNYDFSYVDGTLSITKAMLTATADNKTRAYGDANPALTITYTGFKNGETASIIDTTATATTAAINTTAVGTYGITASGAVDNNYDFTYIDGTLSITKATLTATANNKTRVYGDSNPALTITYTGFKNGETSSVLTTGATAATIADNLSNTGSYAITASGATAGNYDITHVDGTMTVTKATLTATAQDATRQQYTANPMFAISYTGFKNGENSSVIDTLPSASSANINSAPGTYAIIASGAADNNYAFSYVPGILTVTASSAPPPEPPSPKDEIVNVVNSANQQNVQASINNTVMPFNTGWSNDSIFTSGDNRENPIIIIPDNQAYTMPEDTGNLFIAMTASIEKEFNLDDRKRKRYQ